MFRLTLLLLPFLAVTVAARRCEEPPPIPAEVCEVKLAELNACDQLVITQQPYDRAFCRRALVTVEECDLQVVRPTDEDYKADRWSRIDVWAQDEQGHWYLDRTYEVSDEPNIYNDVSSPLNQEG